MTNNNIFNKWFLFKPLLNTIIIVKIQVAGDMVGILGEKDGLILEAWYHAIEYVVNKFFQMNEILRKQLIDLFWGYVCVVYSSLL